ncbi:MAG: hypothetical protein Aurels2KO_40390 [Aureliella sp.]
MLAWTGFWIATWLGIVASGAVAGLALGGVILLVSINPELGTPSIAVYVFAGGALAATVGAGVLACTVFLTLLFRSFHSPKNLAALAGGITAGLCGSVLLVFVVVLIPLGALGGWLGASLFMKTSIAEPLVLFAQLREHQRLQKQSDDWPS